MRKTILLTFALAITFGVFAKNPPLASAPGEMASSPDLAELSDTTVIQDAALTPAAAFGKRAAAIVPAAIRNLSAAVNNRIRTAVPAALRVFTDTVPGASNESFPGTNPPILVEIVSAHKSPSNSTERNPIVFSRMPGTVVEDLSVSVPRLSAPDRKLGGTEWNLGATDRALTAFARTPGMLDENFTVSVPRLAAPDKKPGATEWNLGAAGRDLTAFARTPGMLDANFTVSVPRLAAPDKKQGATEWNLGATDRALTAFARTPGMLDENFTVSVPRLAAPERKTGRTEWNLSPTDRTLSTVDGTSAAADPMMMISPVSILGVPAPKLEAFSSLAGITDRTFSIIERTPSEIENKPMAPKGNPLISPMPYMLGSKPISVSLLDRAQSRFLRLNLDGWKTTAESTRAVAKPVEQKVDGSYCDKDFVGDPITFSQTAELTLDDLLFQIHNRFGINFLMGDGIANMPINIKTGSIPWNTLLASQLFVSGVRANCISPNTIQLVRNDALPKLQSAVEVKPTFIKLKYLQPTSGGNVDIAGRTSGRGGASGSGRSGGGQGGCDSGSGGGGSSGGSQNCGPFEKLIIEIEKILGIRSQTQSSVGGGGGFGGGGGGTQAQATEPIKTNRQVSQVPGRSMLFVRATDEELALINEIVARADRAPFQVIIRGLVYTANENKLRDIGIQTSIFAQKADGTTSGGIFGQPVPSNGTLFDFSSLVGTVEFNATANALAQNGVISIKSRPFTTVLDGDTADLDVGRQIPVLVQALNSVGGTPGTLEILDAGNILSVTPFVLDDENGKPIGVNLTIQLESNDVDTSVTSQGVPSVNRRSIQTRMILNQEKTVILGGFTVDSDSRDVTKTPGLGDIPILGNLFKRKVRRSELNRLYFAISVEIMTYPKVISPTNVPGANTDIPSITPEMKKRSDEAEPKQVVGPPPAKDDGP